MCKQCENSPVYEFTNKRKLCRNCFVKYFQKKFLYTIRKFRMLKSGDTLAFRNGGGFRDAVLEDALKLFSKRAGIKLIRKKSSSGKTAVSSTLDSETEEIIRTIISRDVKNMKKSSPINKNAIKPLYLFTDEEVLLYAKLRNLKFKKEKEKKSKISDFINSLEKKHPEIKRAIISSYLKISSKQK